MKVPIKRRRRTSKSFRIKKKKQKIHCSRKKLIPVSWAKH